MSNIVWDAENGWHDGEKVAVTLDEQGRITANRPILWAAVQVCGECGKGHFQTAKDYGYGPVCEVCEHVHSVDPTNLDEGEGFGYDSHGHLTVTAYDTTEED